MHGEMLPFLAALYSTSAIALNPWWCAANGVLLSCRLTLQAHIEARPFHACPWVEGFVVAAPKEFGIISCGPRSRDPSFQATKQEVFVRVLFF